MQQIQQVVATNSEVTARTKAVATFFIIDTTISVVIATYFEIVATTTEIVATITKIVL